MSHSWYVRPHRLRIKDVFCHLRLLLMYFQGFTGLLCATPLLKFILLKSVVPHVIPYFSLSESVCLLVS